MNRFRELTFTSSVKGVQERMGSRNAYARQQGSPHEGGMLGPDEREFIEARDSFYMASIGEGGWPYVQHRGGPKGFARVLDERTIGFADFRGNRQYVSVGNIEHDDRVSLIFVDYPHRARLKLLARARVVTAADDPEAIARLAVAGYPAKIEHGILLRVEGFDWNCPQHIVPRFTIEEVEALIGAPLARS